MDSSSASTSACPQEADKQCPIMLPVAVDEGPTQEPLPLPPPILNDYPDVLHAWKMVNWVYELRAKAGGIASTPSSHHLLTPAA